MPDGVQIQLLGSFRVTTDSGATVMPRGAKSQAILAYLAFHLNKPIERGRLIELFWYDRDVEQGQGSLRQALSQIRRSLEAQDLNILRTSRRTVMLSGNPGATDLWDANGKIKFENNRPFLNNIPLISNGFDDWLINTQRLVLSKQVLAAEKALEKVDQNADPVRTAQIAKCVVALDPCNEPATRLLMSAFAALGQISATKAAYDALEAALAADGFDVGPATVDLYHDLRLQAGSTPTNFVSADRSNTRPWGMIPMLRIEPVDASAQFNPTTLSLHEALVDSCLERLVQLPEISVQDARLSHHRTSPAYSLGCKVNGNQDHPIAHLILTDLVRSEIIWSTRQPLDPQKSYHNLSVVADIAAAGILAVIERTEQKRFSQSAEPPSTAYQHYLTAKRIFFEASETSFMQTVENHLETALKIDSSFEPAYIHLIQSYNNARFLSEPGRDLTLGRERALELARRLLGLNAMHPNAHIAMAWCQIWRRNFPLAERHFDRALNLGAYEAHRLNAIGTGLIYLGHTDKGAACYDQAQDRMLTELEYQRTDNGELAYLRGDFEAAISWLDTGERHAPYRSSFWQALSYAQLDRIAECATSLHKMTEAAAPLWHGDAPITTQSLIEWLLGTLPLQRRVDMDLVLNGIKKARIRIDSQAVLHLPTHAR